MVMDLDLDGRWDLEKALLALGWKLRPGKRQIPLQRSIEAEGSRRSGQMLAGRDC
jgi:hypothetical protein